MKLQILTLDVWGNPLDGFDVNNIYESGFFITDVPEDFRERDMIAALKLVGFLAPRARYDQFSITGDNGAYYVEHRKHGPVCEIRELDDGVFEDKTSSSWMFDKPLVYEKAKILKWVGK
jgi:hypothetical protein